MKHDHLCASQQASFCLECASIETIREYERYRVVEQIAAMPQELTRDQVMEAIRPLSEDPLHGREPRADLGFH